VLVVAVAGFAVWAAWMHHDHELVRRRRAQAAIVARADRQHSQVLAGDDRGVYGDYRPHFFPVDRRNVNTNQIAPLK
jgi:hypothetical protein